jgi:hypothetical protein
MYRALVSHHPAWTFNVTTFAGVLVSCRAATRYATQLACGLRGHQMLMRYQPNRLSLRCSSCGRESPGWEVGRRSAGDSSTSMRARRKGGTVPLRRVA